MKVSTTTVTDAAAILLDASRDALSAMVENLDGTDSVWVGGADVNVTDKGWEVAPGDVLTVDVPSGDALWAVAAATKTPDVKTIRDGG